jgi:plastocyanin
MGDELAVVLAAALVSVLIASGAVPAATGQSTTVTTPQSSGVIVTIPSGTGSNSGLNFSPSTLKLVIGVNNTVTWTNDDSTKHSVTASDGSFNATLAPGTTFTHTFASAGTFDYHCIFHNFMKGTVTVLAASSTATSSSGGGIPEFPFAALAVALVTSLVVLSYLAVRRTRRS